MPYLNAWASGDRSVLLHFADDVLAMFMRHRQLDDDAREAGGLLLGSVHHVSLLITTATVPTERDKRHRFQFERLPFGHRAIAQTAWRASGGLIRYLGEWHTHPEDIPHPSLLDRSEWIRLASGRLDRRPMLAVIVGRTQLHVELVCREGKRIIMKPMGEETTD